MVIARLFNTVGPRQNSQYGNVVPRFVQRALAGEPLEARTQKLLGKDSLYQHYQATLAITYVNVGILQT